MTIKTTANTTSRKQTLERKLKEWNLTHYKQNDDDSILSESSEQIVMSKVKGKSKQKAPAISKNTLTLLNIHVR